MKYAYEDLSPDQFETLVTCICQRLLGIATQRFSTGPDGGRDAKFIGTAELHPSRTAPWVGSTVIQAKHTNGYNKSFSETDFFSPTSTETIIGDEIPKINALRSNGQLDHYMLFSNRRLSANTETAIRNHISTVCELPIESIYLCGVEQLEILLRTFPEIENIAEIDPIDSPLIVSSDELAEVIEAFAVHRNAITEAIANPPTPRIAYNRKNTLNNMSAEYAKQLRQRYLKETAQIKAFLASPENSRLLNRYEVVVDEFQLQIVSHREDYQSFDLVIEYLVKLLFDRDAVLRHHKRLTRTMIFYMYWNCDIGKNDDTETI